MKIIIFILVSLFIILLAEIICYVTTDVTLLCLSNWLKFKRNFKTGQSLIYVTHDCKNPFNDDVIHKINLLEVRENDYGELYANISECKNGEEIVHYNTVTMSAIELYKNGYIYI